MFRKRVKLSPSMMCADFLNLKDEIELFEEMDIEYLHIDIMDGHYVPNFTLGTGFCRILSEHSHIPLDLHLMIENVDKYIPIFIKEIITGREKLLNKVNLQRSPIITFQVEAEYHPIRQLDLIKSLGMRAGIAIDPSTTLESLKYILPNVDMICIMTVNPGYSGQTLVINMIDKIAKINEYIESTGLNIEIEVDGNVSWKNIPKMISAGADILVSGTSSLFDRNIDRREAIRKLRELTLSAELRNA